MLFGDQFESELGVLEIVTFDNLSRGGGLIIHLGHIIRTIQYTQFSSVHTN